MQWSVTCDPVVCLERASLMRAPREDYARERQPGFHFWLFAGNLIIEPGTVRTAYAEAI